MTPERIEQWKQVETLLKTANDILIEMAQEEGQGDRSNRLKVSIAIANARTNIIRLAY